MKNLRAPLLCCLIACGIGFALPTPVEARSRHHRRVKRKIRKQARRLFKRAQKHYRLGRFERARALYERAYELLPLAGFLYNIAQCHRMEGNHERALFFYKSYLSEKPKARNRALVMTLMKRCDRALAEKRARRRRGEARRRALAAARLRAARLAARPRPRTALPPPPPPRARPLTRRWWFWTSIAGGVVAAVVTGLAIGLSSTPQTVLPSGSLGTLDRR